jgi:ABC-type phosphate/phosphonate transport system ATPase subunit
VKPNGFEHELQDVVRHYQQGRRVVQAVRGVRLAIADGEFVSIMGPSEHQAAFLEAWHGHFGAGG